MKKTLLLFCLVSQTLVAQEVSSTSQVYNFDVDKNKSYDYLYIDESVGKFYALIIGVNNYYDRNIQKLDNPLSDAENLIKTLTTNYNFEKENVTFLKDPVRVEIIQMFETLISKLKPTKGVKTKGTL